MQFQPIGIRDPDHDIAKNHRPPSVDGHPDDIVVVNPKPQSVCGTHMDVPQRAYQATDQ